jgi:hypothetical protein
LRQKVRKPGEVEEWEARVGNGPPERDAEVKLENSDGQVGWVGCAEGGFHNNGVE